MLISCKSDETNFWGQFSQVNFKVKNDSKNSIFNAKITFKSSSSPAFDEIIIDLKPFQEIEFSYNLEKLSTLEEGSSYLKLSNKIDQDYLFYFEAMGSYYNKINIEIKENIVTVKSERIPR